ncbi:signal recognition particle protein [archaeon]|jgi:signal recognition particle subunit SRP54|nr:signal recognition particle protein [archaeon]MBT6182258.1 signal recognition particle protein [archaeon]MBT6606195.1 signal recognition particle protein [archaeon]MBT7251636.1 signal recognition particle protein [archaeon]MBT7661074.1 signal recognition particle protein [archaeon]
MVFDTLGNALKSGVKKISNAIFVDKKLIDGIVKDIQRAMIEADVSIELVLSLSQKIKKLAYDESIKGIDKKEQLITLIHDEIEGLLGEEKELKLSKKSSIMFVGLYGSGKTTTIAKLGFYYAKRGRKVALLGLDVDRPAAMDQLEQMAEKAKVACFIDKKEKNPVKIIEKYKKDLEKYDLVLIDTAGRDGLNDELIKQIEMLDKKLKPEHRILVMPGDIGQAAKTQSEEFQKALNIDGVIITRMDGTSKGGGALTACAETKAPVYFIGVGEQLHEIERFNPKSFISRLLGMGDLESLLEKVKSATDEGYQERMEERMKEGKFTFLDLYSQLEQMNKMGSMDKLVGMIPGMSAAKVPKGVMDKQEAKMKHWKSAISSMTEEEIENPELLEKQTKRIGRIAKGSGTTTTEIRELLKQYKMLKEMMQMQGGMAEGAMDQKAMMKMAKKFKGKMKV